MCLACDMEGLWFAVMEARAAAGAATGTDQPDEPATLLPPPERERVGEGGAGDVHQTGGVMGGESEDPHPNPPPEEGGGSARSERQRAAPSRRFACEETSAE